MLLDRNKHTTLIQKVSGGAAKHASHKPTLQSIVPGVPNLIGLRLVGHNANPHIMNRTLVLPDADSPA